MKIAAALLMTISGAIYAQQSPRAIVTVEPRDGAEAVEPDRDHVTASVNGKPAGIREWTHLTGSNAALQIYIAIDDGTRTDVANQYGDLRSFMQSQPATTQIGIAYLQNGIARIAQQPTSDHGAAGKALRVPLGQPDISASPYVALSDLFRKWPAAEARREVLLISSGIDPLYGGKDLQDPYLDKTAQDALRGAIVVNNIYFAAAGHAGHSFFGVTWGQNYLSQIAEGTGGEFYWQGDRSPVSFAPFMKDLQVRLNNQYLLTLNPAGLPTGFDALKVSTSAPKMSLVAPSRIYVPK